MRNLSAVPKPAAVALGSLILSPPTPHYRTHLFFCSITYWSGKQRLRRRSKRGSHLSCCTPLGPWLTAPSFPLSHPLPCSLFWPLGWIMGLRPFLSVWGGQRGTSLGWSVVVSVVRRGLGVRESLVYRLCVFTFLMVSASFRDCWKSKEMLLFCLVMEKSNPIHQGIQMKKANLFIWWAPANAFWVGSGMTSLMILRHPQWTEAWEKPDDPPQYSITHVELCKYLYCSLQQLTQLIKSQCVLFSFVLNHYTVHFMHIHGFQLIWIIFNVVIILHYHSVFWLMILNYV